MIIEFQRMAEDLEKDMRAIYAVLSDLGLSPEEVEKAEMGIQYRQTLSGRRMIVDILSGERPKRSENLKIINSVHDTNLSEDVIRDQVHRAFGFSNNEEIVELHQRMAKLYNSENLIYFKVKQNMPITYQGAPAVGVLSVTIAERKPIRASSVIKLMVKRTV